MKKRIISLLLAMIMVLGMIPMTVLAEEACTHTNTTASYEDVDGKHVKTLVCDDCGAAVALDTLAYDFKAYAKEVAQQDFWDNLYTATNYNGETVKCIGVYRGGTLTEDQTLALADFEAWNNAREWKVETLYATYGSNRMYFCADDAVYWGIAHHSYYCNVDKQSDMVVTVTVDEAGKYDLAFDVEMQKPGAGQSPNDEVQANGSGYGDIYVNGTLVKSDVYFSTTNDGYTERGTIDIGTIDLVEGTNTVTVRSTYDYSKGGGYAGRRWQFFRGMTLSQTAASVDCFDTDGDGKCELCGTVCGECQHRQTKDVLVSSNEDGTHNVTRECLVCGEPAPLAQLNYDLKAYAQEAAEQDFWDNLYTTTNYNGETVKCIGIYRTGALTEEQTAAVAAFETWNNAREWKVETPYAVGGNNRMYLCADETVYWGVGHHSYFCNVDQQSDLVFTVTVDEAGQYELALDLDMQKAGCGQSVNDQIQSNGCGYGDIYINGVQTFVDVYFSTTGSGYYEHGVKELGTVTLNAGVNTITIRTTKEIGGTVAYASRQWQLIRGMSLNQSVAVVDCVDENGDGICEICNDQFRDCQHYDCSYVAGTANEDGTHNVTKVCNNCGETVELAPVVYDFKEYAKEASEQSWYEDLTTVNMHNTDIPAKRLGECAYNPTHTEEHIAAVKAYNDWVASRDWGVTTDYTLEMGNALYLLPSENYTWGVCHHAYFNNFTEGYSDMDIKLTAADAGTYDVSLDVRLQRPGCSDFANDGITNAGGYADILVNGEVIAEHVDFANRDLNYWSKDGVIELGEIFLNKGENTITIRTVARYDDSVTYAGYNRENLIAMTVTPTNLVDICVDENADGVCDNCGAGLKTDCDHAETTSETVYNDNKTHTTTVTCVCGEVVETVTADCVDEDKDCVCDTCEGVIKTVTKTTVAGSNMNLGNELQVNFIVNNPVDGDYVAYIHQDTDDEGGLTIEIPEAEWEAFGTTRQKIAVRVRAMEMTDTLTLTIKDADGYDIIDAYTTSVREYAAKALVAASSSAEMKTLVVDMVNYGAAAQTNFGYKAEDLANNQLTKEQAALATGDVVCENNQVKGTNNIGSNLALDDCILLNVYFQGLKGKDMSTIHAKVSFTNWKDEYIEVTVPGTEFELYGTTGDRYKVIVDDVVLADASCLVTVELYEDGVTDPIAYGADSVESYANRGSATSAAPLYNAIMKFATSAKAYLLSRQ